jgi:protein phosphatase
MSTEQPRPAAQASTIVPPAPGAGSARVRVEIAARTEVGKVRPNNEDQYLVARLVKVLEVLATSLPDDPRPALPDPEGYLMLVADGIGGSAGGERASALAVEAAKTHVLRTAKWFFRLDDPDEEVRIRRLRETLEELDRRIIAEAEADPSLHGMGTTLTTASSIGAEAFIVHVGDSRAYLFRQGRLKQVTQDHTFAQFLLETGYLRPEEVRTHRARHVLTNALGGHRGVRAEMHKLHLADGDRLLLCTDGLTDLVEDEAIAEILRLRPRAEEACGALVDVALERGGKDNVTVVVAAYAIGAA